MNKNAFITGANSDIGKEIALRLASLGYHIFVTSKNDMKLLENYDDIDHTYGISSMTADLSDPQESLEIANWLKNRIKKLDVFVHVAGIYHDNKKRF